MSDTAPWLQNRQDELILAAGLLTRLRIPLAVKNQELTPAHGLWAFPLVGALVGLISALAYYIISLAGFPPSIAAIGSLAAAALTTGLLHEDGLADFADSAGATSQEEKIKIMRDSRIGTYGVCALIASFAARGVSISHIQPSDVVLIIIVAHIASRSLIALHYQLLQPASVSGLAKSAGHPTADRIIAAIAIGVAAALLILPFPLALITLAACLVACLTITLYVKYSLGGYTGDTLGATQQVAEVTILLAATTTWAPT